jgi:5-(carboxyamino)imidazole ribonucleotide synthase
MIGILGGGQLGRMLALAAARLGFDCCVLAPEADSPAMRVAASQIVAAYDDEAALSEFVKRCDVTTFEFENVPARSILHLQARGLIVAPGPRALAVAQDRISEKTFFAERGIACAPFAAIESATDIVNALVRLGTPSILKTRREGYDGKGQTVVSSIDDAVDAFDRIGRLPAILEGKAPFVRELSVIIARGWSGEIAAYPPGWNQHEAGILRRTVTPAPSSPATLGKAVEIARSLVEGLDYVGVMGVELFEMADGALWVNEIAPRVHNTGHWTLDACEVDQFEQHIRAITGWPLGPAQPFASAEMINLLGADADQWESLVADPGARMWLYGKSGAAPGRKMGHVNRLTGPFPS